MTVTTPHVGRGPWTSTRAVSKRLLDLTVTVVILVVVLPLMALIALIVLISSGRPVLFRQTRIGRFGQPFTILKFRTMVAEAEDQQESLLPLNEADGPMFKIYEDPRTTPVGRWLRRSSLDELPQLFHVLSGRMSLVGPRPALPSEAAAYDETAARRLAVLPGVTGLWQVSGRATLSWDESVAIDNRYVDEGSTGGDIIILLRTLPAVFSGRGAA